MRLILEILRIVLDYSCNVHTERDKIYPKSSGASFDNMV